MGGNQFVKGRTNNHLTWVGVDATDFASPESALSAATKIKIYGKLRGATGVNFVSSGTGSLTNDIVHVGASALGIYTIALAKADLSDASAAWYDQYIISLSATGAAYQTIIVDGGIDLSALSALQSRVSDMQSYLVAMSGVQSDIYSALSDFQSDFGSRVPKRVATDSQLSDVLSDLRSFVGAGVALDASTMSDIRSAITAGPTGTVTASDISDIASAVWAAKYTAHSAASSFGSLFSDIYSRVVLIQSSASDAASAAAQANSRVLLNQSRISDVYSLLSDLQSDFQSRVTGIVPTGSDVASKVWAEKYTAASNVKASTFGSLVRLGASAASDAYSAALIIQSRLSDFDSRLVSDVSDIRSMLTALSDAISDAHSDLGSKIGLVASNVSDIESQIDAGVPLDASTISDLRSAITATELDASDLSDIASAVWATTRTEPTTVVSPTGTMKTGIEWLVALSRNKITQTATLQSLRNDADNSTIASATVSDDATTFTRNEFAG